MRLYKRKDSAQWWATWSQNGERFRRSTGTDNRQLAKALTAKWVQEDFLAEHFGKKPELPFSEALLRYAKAQKRDHPRHFMSNTRYRLRYFAARFKGWNVSDLTFKAMQDFVDEHIEKMSSGSVARDIAVIKAILNKARREDLTDFVPNFPRVKGSKPRTRWLTMDEERRLIDNAAPHLKYLIRFAVDTGGRKSEILGLDWRDVDLVQKRVTFRDTKENGEDRTLRLCQRAEATLRGLGPRDTGIVFTFRGQPIKSLKTSWSKACDNAEIEDLRFHDLRHTFASRLVQAGIPLFEVMGLTGHKSLEMVQRYSHLAPDYQERAILALDQLGHDSGTVEISGDRESAPKSLKGMVPLVRLELTTPSLRMMCSTN